MPRVVLRCFRWNAGALGARGDLINTPLQRGEMAPRGTFNRFSGFSMRGARLQHRWETAKAVKAPRQPASTPLKRGVNESPSHSTQYSEEPPAFAR